ncbi:hypothetical protein CDAR_124381 [Caerostris darwini]|uniref:Uncharacterized protein n=1 Tax=Caerostris darwini TaxID=1538125 RepID=A0AAV4W7F2_9ARAC|nr:hypothetical protein CDAR_124381 [Caerostris darwini]
MCRRLYFWPKKYFSMKSNIDPGDLSLNLNIGTCDRQIACSVSSDKSLPLRSRTHNQPSKRDSLAFKSELIFSRHRMSRLFIVIPERFRSKPQEENGPTRGLLQCWPKEGMPRQSQQSNSQEGRFQWGLRVMDCSGEDSDAWRVWEWEC